MVYAAEYKKKTNSGAANEPTELPRKQQQIFSKYRQANPIIKWYLVLSTKMR